MDASSTQQQTTNEQNAKSPFTTAPCEATKRTLDLFLKGAAAYQLFSYEAQFDRLWGIGAWKGKGIADTPVSGTLIVVYDGMPKEEEEGRLGISVKNRVGIYDWLAHFFLKTEKEAPDVRACIVDIVSPRKDTSFAARTMPALLPLMPWVRVYRLFQRTEMQELFGSGHTGLLRMLADIKGDHMPPAPYLERALEGSIPQEDQREDTWLQRLWLKITDVIRGRLASSAHPRPITTSSLVQANAEEAQPFPSLQNVKASTPRLIETAQVLVQESWIKDLTRAEHRHDVSNLIAPLVLAQGLKGLPHSKTARTSVLGGSAASLALEELLKSLGLPDSATTQKLSGFNVSVTTTSSSSYHVKPLEDASIVEEDLFGSFSDPVRVLLVDDNAHLGYEDILTCVLGQKKGKFAVTITRSPTLLVEWLARAWQSTVNPQLDPEEIWNLPRIISGPTDSGSDGFDILLLDLRLFRGSGRPIGMTESQFLQKLTDFYIQSRAETTEDQHLKKAYEATRLRLVRLQADESPTEVEHLAFLPLLLSQIDPSLPIVLFSSTHQRTILDAVSHRPNIISTFSKPLISGYLEMTSPVEYVQILKDALAESLRLHEARTIWQRLPNFKWTSKTVFSCNMPDPTATFVVQLFNAPGQPSVAPRLDEHKLRIRLREIYVQYILRANYFDFASIPFEMLEGSLVPDAALTSVDYYNTGFNTPTPMLRGGMPSEPYSSKNQIARILQNTRTRKAHGNLPRRGSRPSSEEHRTVAILLLLLLLDYLEDSPPGAYRVNASQHRGHIRIWNYLRSVYPYLPAGRDPLPVILNSHQDISWFHFVLYSTAFHVGEMFKGGSHISENTFLSLNRMIDRYIP
ncbi:MAG: hypothetical protein ACE5FB_00560 [Candidatus Binatia bacterium]